MGDLFPEIQFTAVIPTYNRGALAARAVQSVLAQTKRPLEIIVVDDGSQDDTKAQIDALGDAVTYVYQPNAGSAAARNNGMRRAQCDWIALLDSDDVWQPDHLEKMAAAIAATNGVGCFYFADTIRPSEKGGGSRWEAVDFYASKPHQLCDSAADWVLMRPQPMMLQSTVFNKAAYLAAGGFLPVLRYRDDTHLFLKLGLDGAVCAVSHLGTVMTSDDVPENRLTLSYDHGLRGNQMQVIMFEDLLQSMPHLSAAHRQELQQRLSYAYLALARHAWRKRRFSDLARQISRAIATQPGILFGSMQRGIAKLGR